MFKKNEDSLLEKWRRIHKFFDIKSGTIIGLFSLEMLAIIAYYATTNQNLPITVRDVYLGVITAFTGNSIAKVIKGVKEDATKD